jgi:hypothetical protein
MFECCHIFVAIHTKTQQSTYLFPEKKFQDYTVPDTKVYFMRAAVSSKFITLSNSLRITAVSRVYFRGNEVNAKPS